MSTDTEEANYQWLLLNDISLMQQSLLDTHNDSSILGLEDVGLGDLSCSLIHCDGLKGDCGDHDFGGADPLIDVERFCGEVRKRDKIIATLFNKLTTIVKNREDEDVILTSVENEMGLLHEDIEHRRTLNSSTHTSQAGSGNEEIKNFSGNQQKSEKYTNSETQTESTTQATIKKDTVNFVHKEVQCMLKSPNSKTAKVSSKVVSPESVKISCETQTTDELGQEKLRETQENNEQRIEKHNKSNDSDSFDMDVYGSPNSLAIQPTNLDMFRLTFSPSICEYEAETNTSRKRSDHDLSVVEDLKLQFNDTERKFEATKKYLEEMTAEREQEREDFQRTINDLVIRYEELKKERDKMELVVQQQKTELEDMAEVIQDSNGIRDEVLLKSVAAENELKHAVEKICELRDIIRALEEQVEEATKHANLYSDRRKGINEESAVEEFSKTSCNELFRPQDDEGASELDITVELQAQVQELAKRIEDKLLELENFSWQTRPGSSCSVKSGDDVSVRAADRVHFNDENDVTDQDLVSQVFCGLRRLECSFDTLVRFEEVLLKKIKDADMKISIDSKRLEEITGENSKLRQDLGLCRQKILDFENFMSETKKSFSEASTPNAEAPRTYGNSFTHRFEESSPGIKRPRSKGQAETEQPLNDIADIERLEPYDEANEYGIDETSNPLDNRSVSNGDDGMLEKDEDELPLEYGKDEFSEDLSDFNYDENDVPDPILTNSDAPIVGRGNSNGGGPNSKPRGSNIQGNEPETSQDGMLETDGKTNSRLSGLVLETNLEENPNSESSGPNSVSDQAEPNGSRGNSLSDPAGPQGSSGSRNNSILGAPGGNGSRNNSTSGPEGGNGSRNNSTSGLEGGNGSRNNSTSGLEGGNGSRNNSLLDAPGGNGSRKNSTSDPQGGNGSRNNSTSGPQGGNGSRNNSLLDAPGGNESQNNSISGPQGGNGSRNNSMSDPLSRNGGNAQPVPEQNGVLDNEKSGPGRNSDAGNVLNKDPKTSKMRDPEDSPQHYVGDNMLENGQNDDEDVITYDVTTVSDYEVDGDNLKYIGSKILPPEDPNRQTDDQLNRLQGTDAKIELEKLKTKWDQLQRALEAEKQKSLELAKQLDEVVNGPQMPQTDIPSNENHSNSLNAANPLGNQSAPKEGLGSRGPNNEPLTLEEYADDLEKMLQERNRTVCKLKRNLDCIKLAYQQLQEENQDLRSYADQLESELEGYVS